LIDDPITLEELSDSVSIFDDIDVIPNKKVREAVYSLLNQILETGRHTRT
jgi:Mor family transcriptional regulator